MQTPRPTLETIATVHELMKLSLTEPTYEWNEDLIKTLFWPKEAKTILGIPLGQIDKEKLSRVLLTMVPFWSGVQLALEQHNSNWGVVSHAIEEKRR